MDLAEIEYKYIYAWGKFMHSYNSYIEDQMLRAKADNAPKKATFYSFDKKRWNTYDDITNFEVKMNIRSIVSTTFLLR